jgi:hypothetical protein
MPSGPVCALQHPGGIVTASAKGWISFSSRQRVAFQGRRAA